MAQDLTTVLRTIRGGIARKAYPNETSVRTQIVQPILAALGWDVFDPDQVCDEFPLTMKGTTRRIDVALCVSNRNPRCIMELKSTTYDLKEIGRSDGDQQLFEYAFHAGAPLALLTNGTQWRFYSAQSAGTYEERLVSVVDIETDSLDEITAGLDRYLSYANTVSGEAADHAREDLSARRDRHKARMALPQAWDQLVEDERLASLLSDMTWSRVETRPDRRDVAAFLRSLKSGGLPAPVAPVAPPETRGTKVGPSVSRATAHGAGAITYCLLGAERHARNAKEAYVSIFDALARRDPRFLARMEPKLRGRKIRGLARAKHDVSPLESVLAAAVSLPGGWWLHTHLSNDGKTRHLETACEVAGIRFGDPAGLDISLPTRHRTGNA